MWCCGEWGCKGGDGLRGGGGGGDGGGGGGGMVGCMCVHSEFRWTCTSLRAPGP